VLVTPPERDHETRLTTGMRRSTAIPTNTTRAKIFNALMDPLRRDSALAVRTPVMRGDRDHQWGAQLLREALEKLVASVDLGGGQIIVVDADNPGLIAWYSRQGFKSTGGQKFASLHEGRDGKKVPGTEVARRES
jgi:hypothetical protein